MNDNGIHVYPRQAVFRPGFSIVELLVATSSATVLLIGLVSAIAIAGRAFQPAASDETHRLANVTHDIARTLASAKRITSQTANAITCIVPDRTGDGIDDAVAYQWSGTPGSPLSISVNNSLQHPVSSALNSVDFSRTDILAQTRSLSPLSQVRFVGFSEAKVEGAESIDTASPAAASAGDLLIMAVATNSNRTSTLAADASWNKIIIGDRAGEVTLGVWWRIASGTPTVHTATWNSIEDCYATIVAFKGQDPAAPIAFEASDSGTSKTPTAPAIVSSRAESMVVSIMAADGAPINLDRCAMEGAYTVTLDHSVESVCIGVTVAQKISAGSNGARTFRLNAAEEYVSVSLVIQPAL